MRRFRIGSLVAAVVAITLCSLDAEAKPPASHDSLNGFRLSGRFGYFEDGKAIPRARLYYAPKARAYLLANLGGRKDALLLRTSNPAHAVESVPLEDLIRREDGTRDLKRSARIKPVGRYFSKGREIRLEGKGLNATLRTKPHLVGWKTVRDLLQHKPEYGHASVSVRSDPAKVKSLKARKSKIIVNVYFGSWCTECDKVLPYIIHMDQALSANKNIQFRYYGLASKETYKQDSEIVKTRVTKLPTGLVLIDGKEANRIIQKEWTTPALTMDAIITTAEMTKNKNSVGQR